MTKAKPLDRVELTRRKMQRGTNQNHSGEVIGTAKLTAPHGYDKCPVCGAMALIHEGGCEHCSNCGYDACGLH